jgi:hypothetical protein
MALARAARVSPAPRSTRRGRFLLWAAAASLAVGCASYERVRMEFDSVTRFDGFDDEPAELDYQQLAKRWPWTVRATEGSGFDSVLAFLFGLEPYPMPIDNPVGFVRERIPMLVELADGDPAESAEVARRLLWVLERDEQSLNRVVAIEGIATLLEAMAVDPLRRPMARDARDPAQEAVAAAWGALAERGPARGDAPLSVEQRSAWVRALETLTERPLGRGADDRRLLHALAVAQRDEQDRALREPVRRALAAAAANAMADGLRRHLLDGTPEVREAALLALYRLGGSAALAYSLRALSLPTGGLQRYDQSRSIRLLWIRMCSQVGGDVVFQQHAGGPTGIEFLYDMVRGDDDGLRLNALEAMAICLGRPISFDAAWADEWWREYSLARRRPSR